MPSNYEQFFTHGSFAIVGHSAKRPFARLSLGELKRHGKKVFAIDPSVPSIDGERTFSSFDQLPEQVEAAILELPKDETKDWVQRAADAGIKELWLHMNTDTPEAVELAKSRGMNVRTGTCAVMYLANGFSAHGLHRFINKLRKVF